MTFTIRPATLADVDELGRLHVRCWEQTYSHILSPEALGRMTAEDMTEMWRRVVGRASADAQAVAELDGEIVGFASCGPSREKDLSGGVELFFIYLLTEHHGSGIGQALLEALERPEVLWVAADNPRAQAFYRRNHFAADGATQTEEFFGELIDEIRMVRA